jgi:hypothetical protein
VDAEYIVAEPVDKWLRDPQNLDGTADLKASTSLAVRSNRLRRRVIHHEGNPRVSLNVAVFLGTAEVWSSDVDRSCVHIHAVGHWVILWRSCRAYGCQSA